MIYSLDYGKGVIILAWGQGQHEHSVHKKFSELLQHIPVGSVLICERSLANFDRDDYNAGLILAEEKGIELRAVSTHAVKGYRKKIGDPKPPTNKATTADDIKDAKILLLLFGEGSKRAYGTFKPYIPKPLPTDLRDRVKALIVDARRYGKWKEQKKWLKVHGFELAPALCSALVVANEIRSKGLSRRVYRKFTRISEFGRANTTHRSNCTFWVYRNNKKKNWGSLDDRKGRGKALNSMFDRIWHQLAIPDGVLPI